jgi:RNA recognition motif-containing protein
MKMNVHYKSVKSVLMCLIDDDEEEEDDEEEVAPGKRKASESEQPAKKAKFEPAQAKTPENKFGQRGDDSCTMFVKNLPSDVTEDSLRELFEGATNIRLPTNYDGSAKG